MTPDFHTFLMSVATREIGPLSAIFDSHLRVAEDGEIFVADETSLGTAVASHLAAAAVRGADTSASLSLIVEYLPLLEEPACPTLINEVSRLVAPHTSLGRLAGIFNPTAGTA